MSDDDLRVLNANELYESDEEPPSYIIHPLLAEGSVMMFYGESGRGKTSAAYQLAHAVADDEEDWFGFDVRSSGPVFFLELDMMEQETRLFLERVQKANNLHDDIWFPDLRNRPESDAERWEDFDILSDVWKNRLEWVCNEIKPAVVVVDTVEDAYADSDVTPRKVKRILDRLRLAVRPAALVFTRHKRKATKSWGESEGDTDSMSRGSFSGFGQWEQAPTATSIQIGRTKLTGDEMKPKETEVLKLQKTRLGNPGFKFLELERTEHGFFYVDRDYRQLLRDWPEDLRKWSPAEARAEADSVSDVCHQVAAAARENPETVRRHYYRARGDGVVYDWMKDFDVEL